MRLLVVFVPLVLTGCPASVTAEGMEDGFGLGFGAAWVHVDDGDSESDSVVIANYGDVCTKTQAFYEAFAEFSDAATDVMSKNYCENVEEPFLAYVEAASALQFEGAHVVSLGFSGDLNDKEYEFDDDASGFVFEITESPWEGVAEDFDADGSITDGCGVGTLDDDFSDSWTLTDGTVEITALTDEASASGVVDARMKESGSGGDKSDFAASFSAAWCEIDL